MARPGKEWLDYFPLDCHIDDKIKMIEAEYGLKGFAIIIKLYQQIYGSHGYYCEWNRDTAFLFARENLSTGDDGVNLINSVVSAAIRRDIFSEDLYQKYGILTSKGIQKRYFKAAERRTLIEVEKLYLLINVGKNTVNVCNNSINVCNNSKNVSSNSQSKVKEIKIIKDVATKVATAPSYEPSEFELKCVDLLIKSCLKQFENSKVPDTKKRKTDWAAHINKLIRIDGISEKDILDTLNFAINDDFWKPNIRSTKKFREKFETLFLQKNSKTGKKNNFGNFEQRDYDMSALEKEILSN